MIIINISSIHMEQNDFLDILNHYESHFKYKKCGDDVCTIGTPHMSTHA